MNQAAKQPKKTESRRGGFIKIAAVCLRQDDDVFVISQGSGETKVPRAAVRMNNDGTFTMSRWLARHKGLIA